MGKVDKRFFYVPYVPLTKPVVVSYDPAIVGSFECESSMEYVIYNSGKDKYLNVAHRDSAANLQFRWGHHYRDNTFTIDEDETDWFMDGGISQFSNRLGLHAAYHLMVSEESNRGNLWFIPIINEEPDFSQAEKWTNEPDSFGMESNDG